MNREEQIEKARELLACGVLSKEACDAIKNDFPELRESERIRKAVIKAVNEAFMKHGIEGGDLISIDGFKEKDMIAYLEKQKEQKPTPDWMPRFLDELRSKKNYFDWDEHRDIEGHILAIINWIAPNYFEEKEQKSALRLVGDGLYSDPNAHFELIGEQKPVDDKAFEEWIDDWWKHNKVNNPDSYDKGDEIQFDERGFKNFCRGIRNMYQQKPAEWSEEDSKMLDDCIMALSNWRDAVANYGHEVAPCQELIDWLKSLRPSKK